MKKWFKGRWLWVCLGNPQGSGRLCQVPWRSEWLSCYCFFGGGGGYVIGSHTESVSLFRRNKLYIRRCNFPVHGVQWAETEQKQSDGCSSISNPLAFSKRKRWAVWIRPFHSTWSRTCFSQLYSCCVSPEHQGSRGTCLSCRGTLDFKPRKPLTNHKAQELDILINWIFQFIECWSEDHLHFNSSGWLFFQ